MSFVETVPREIASAGVGVGRLIRYDPRWPDGFTPTTSGFLRSFLGPLLALPFALIVAAAYASAEPDHAAATSVSASALITLAAIAHLLYSLGYPVLIGALARPLQIGEGYAGFVIVANWSSLFFNVALAGASSLALFGEPGFAAFGLLAVGLFGLSIFVIWRAAREVLSHEIAVALLAVVLSVGMVALSNQVASLLVGGLSAPAAEATPAAG